MRNFIDDIYDQLRSARTGGYHDGRYNMGYDDGLDYAIAVLEMQTVRCKDCKHRILNKHYGEKGHLQIKAYCDIDPGDLFELGRNVEDDNWFCADAERRQNG